jgi:hypothetical protein
MRPPRGPPRPNAAESTLAQPPSVENSAHIGQGARIDSFKEPEGLVGEMATGPRLTKPARLGAWAALPALLAVFLIAAPTMGASPGAFEKTFHPSYTSHGGREYVGLTPANTSPFNLTSGMLSVNTSEGVTRCQPNASRCLWGFVLDVVGGVKELRLNVSTKGLYNISAKWRGTIFANLSALLNKSSYGTVMANYSIETGLSICCGPLRPKQVWTTLLSSGADYHGNKSVRVAMGVSGPHTILLGPGWSQRKYLLAAYIEVIGYISVSQQAKPGAYAFVSFSSPGGVELKDISIT